MIEPDRGKFELDLGDGGEKVVLWYPPGALRALCKELQLELPLSKILELVEVHLTPTTLPWFVWAGLLWSDRKRKVEPIEERLWATQRGLGEICNEVRNAIFFGIEGKTVEQALVEARAKRKGPQPPTEMDGAGKTPSDSPSGN